MFVDLNSLSSSAQWIPIATSPAGSTLTWQNWQDCNIHTLAFQLDALLVKPGIAALQSFQSLRDFTGWPGRHVLNVCSGGRDKNGSLHILSPFDGSRVSIKHEALCALIVHLAPDALIVPIWLEDTWMSFPYRGKIKSWFACQSSIFQAEGDTSLVYVVDAPEQPELPQSTSHVWFESDKPSQDALAGHMYTQDGILDVLDPIYQQSFIPLDLPCTCTVCEQGFTRAYLHHLYQHTPLLAYRLLMMHNVSLLSGNCQ